MLDGAGMAVIEQDLDELRKAYESDFTKHVDGKDIPRIREIWRSIPSQLSRENKKFVFRVVREGARAREYESALDWLVLSGMVYRIYCTEKPELPMKHYEDTTAFKVYMLDQAMLRNIAELPPEAVISKGDFLKEFKAEDNVNGKSFAEYNKKYEPRIRLRFSLLNIKRSDNMINFPIFLCDWLNDLLPTL